MPTHMYEESHEEMTSEVERLSQFGLANFDRLIDHVYERHLMIMAIMNFAKFHNIDIFLVSPQMVRASSAGVRGWAKAGLSDWHEQATTTHDPMGLVRDDRPPLTMAGQEAFNDEDGTSQPPEPKPLCAPQDSAEVRQRVMGCSESCERSAGDPQATSEVHQLRTKPVGVVKIGDGGKYARGVLDEWWRADGAGNLEDNRLEAHAMCFGPEDKILCAAT